MATSSRRNISTFSLSFLDIMFCGFGAVVLLVLLISSQSRSSREQTLAELRSELSEQELEFRLTSEQVQRQRGERGAVEQRVEELNSKIESAAADLQQARQAGEAASGRQDERQRIAQLQQELKNLEQQNRELARQAEAAALEARQGRQVRAFVGKGNRQYLTGLKLDGKRVLVLVDSSASMLDRKIVDIVRRKVLGADARRQAPKWQKALATVEWLIANLAPQSSIQLAHFNTSASMLGGEKGKGWIPVTDFDKIDALLSELKQVAPLGGTNLEDPFLKARTLTPQPDNIVLITDGLPTQSKQSRRSSTIDGAARVKLYERAIKNLPAGVPVNTVLFPIEGDPLAAALYWKLAVDSGGSFFTPTRDWP